MSPNNSVGGSPVVHLMLPIALTGGIVVRRTRVEDAPAIASNLPPLYHAGRIGFDFGNEGPGASDLALACVHALLARMDYVGPVQQVADGSRVFRLAQELQQPFLVRFIASAQGDELHIGWNQAVGWTRRTLLTLVREQRLTPASLLDAWRSSAAALPDPLPTAELDLASLMRQVRGELAEMTGDASVLSQFLGMIA